MMGRRGFSLIEILVLSASLIPVLLIMISLFPYAYGINGQARELARAQELAASSLERLRGMDFAAVDSSHQTVGNHTVDVAVAVYPLGQVSVRQKKVTVTVTWGRERRLEVQTYLMKWATL